MGDTTIADLLRSPQPTKMVAPMVRMSKLPFRLLCRQYGGPDVVCFTPMILAEPFARSSECRDVEFWPHAEDRPLVVQFAANEAEPLAAAAELVARHCNAVDLNCGCPQGWAVGEGIGAALIRRPELVCDMVRTTLRRTSVPVSIKIRAHADHRETVELCQRAERVGVEWITVHGRTVKQSSKTPVNLDVIRLVKDSVGVPVIANGDVFTPDDVDRITQATGANGVMSARGIMINPALFGGHTATPWSCVDDFIQLSMSLGTSLHVFRRHLAFMCSSHIMRAERRRIDNAISIAGVLDVMEDIRSAAAGGCR